MNAEDIRWARSFIGLGSNIEPREGYLAAALKALKTVGEITKVASIYETTPVGGVPQPDYLNTVLELRTQLGPIELAARLKALEQALGRTSRPKWHEREIDLDLLFYGDLVLDDSPELVIPHPELVRRAFVLIPMAELDPGFMHPAIHQTMRELASNIGNAGVTKTEIII